MCFFVVLDGQSSVSPTDIWNKFDEYCKRNGLEFRVLPISRDVLDVARFNNDQLRERAKYEAERVMQHYVYATCCIVVYAEPQKPPKKHVVQTYFDRAIIQFRDQEPKEVVLNEQLGPTKHGKWYVSGPKLQPLLTDALFELTLIEILGEP